MEDLGDDTCLKRVFTHSIDVLQRQKVPVLPLLSTLRDSRSSLLQKLPDHGVGMKQTTNHLLENVAPALNGSSLSPNYYGFVVGGVTPAARMADSLVSLYDQNSMVHLPDQTIASNVEDKALRLLMDLLQFDQSAWSGVFTTGGTASNVLGLGCGREYAVNKKLERTFGPSSQETLGSLGILRACRLAGIEDIRIYTTMAHSSLYKASSILGLGRSCVQDLGHEGVGIRFDLSTLEVELASSQHNNVSVVVISCSDVNTGLFATQGLIDVQKLRELCDKYGAWLHVDGAFGIFGRMLDRSAEFEGIAQGCQSLELADSIAGDGHKLLNVPYDCGFFLCRHPHISQQVFQNPNAAYLNTRNAATDIVQSPLNVGIENSRRCRGLPVYATLMAYGRMGYTDMLERQIRLARSVAAYLFDHDSFELLPQETYASRDEIYRHIFIIVLFRAKDKVLNEGLVQEINASSRMYVSGTVWQGRTACRIAVANWQVDPDRDIAVVKDVLESVLESKQQA